MSKRKVRLSYGNLQSSVETFLRAVGELKDNEELVSIKWPLGDEQLNLSRADTMLTLEIKVTK